MAAALAVPWGAGWHRSRPGAGLLFVGLYGLYCIAPYTGHVQAWSALGTAVLVMLGSFLWQHPPALPSLGFSLQVPLTSGSGARTRRAGAVLMAGAALLAAWTGGVKTASLVSDLVLSDRAAVQVSALLLAVFGGGALAKAATASVRAEVEAMPEGPEKSKAVEFMGGSRRIGLLERGLLFVFIAAGQPEAAALVLAAKSLARVPTNDHGKHASEYFLIGTLASVIASLAMGMAARAAVGLPVL
ncbi:hypothetical protein OG413_06395 [Streptomyces sp. NBC_01433]|uniref:hypothetical protein n=1 Tax=Streptomyces sp. NBC_01433 TaxID=2903864 RepID=UPI00225A3FB9|nr:hypothetical protein [Streptomyces sp. NBC_01433]MCX4674959.1 hypothetical protein [Streptomyces sp. NBC_01433]